MAVRLSNFGASRAGRVIEMAEPDRHNATLDDLVGMALAVYDRAMEGVLAIDEHGRPILCDGEPLSTPDLASANRAIEIVARLCGLNNVNRLCGPLRHILKRFTAFIVAKLPVGNSRVC